MYSSAEKRQPDLILSIIKNPESGDRTSAMFKSNDQTMKAESTRSEIKETLLKRIRDFRDLIHIY